MAVWSIVRKSELEGALRLDAEYYQPEYLRLKRILSRHPLLEQCIKKIIHPAEIKRVYEEQGLQILLAQNIQHNFLEFSVTVFMPESVQGSISRNKLIPNDVVMTRSGVNYGDAAPYFGEPAPLYACADDLVIRPNQDLPAGYLATFFNTSVGRMLIKRGGYGAAQPHIAPPFLKALHVPRFSRDEEQEVDSLVRLAKDRLKDTEALYRQAEEMLLRELGLDRLRLSQPKYWSVKISRASESHRLDTEHFQPKYDRLIRHLQKTGRTKYLGDIVSYNRRGLQPTYVEDGEIVVVNSQHLGRCLLNVEATERTDESFWQANGRCRLQKGDILFYSTGAYVGRTNVYLEDCKAVASNHVNIIRVKDGVDSLYLSVFLNALPGLLQAEKWASGSGQREVYPEDIARFIVSVPPKSFQQKIANLVTKSYQARQRAKALLEEAKQKVETMIEGKN